MAVDIATVRAAATTSVETQDFTISGFGTPKAAMFIVTKGVTDNTAAAGAMMAVGFTDGTRNKCGTISAKDANATSDTDTTFDTDSCILLADDTGTLADAVFDSWITDGVRIDWTDAPPSAYLVTVVLFGGSDIADVYASHYRAAATGNTLDITAPGFQPTDLLTVLAHDFVAPCLCLGAVHDDGASTVTQACTIYSSRNARQNGENAGYTTETYGSLILRTDGTLFGTQSYSAFDSNGFSATTGGSAAASQDVIYLALRITNHDSYVGTFTTPTSTGNDAQTGPGFKPQFVLQLPTNHAALNTNYSTGEGGTFGVSVIDDTNQFSNMIADEDGAATTDTESQADDQAVVLHDDDGTGLFATAFVSFDTNGFTQNFTATNTGNATYWPIWAVEETAAAGDTIPLDTVTLASSAVALTVIPGAVSILLDVLTLAGSVPALTVVSTVSVLLDELTLASSAEALTVIPGLVSVLLDELTLTGSAESLTVVPGIVAVLLDTLTLVGSPEALAVVPGVIIVLLDSLTLAGSAEALTAVPGVIVVLLDTLTLAGNVENITASLVAAVTVILDTLTLAGSVPSLTVIPGAVAALLNTLTLAGSAESLSAIAGAVTVLLDSLTLAGSAVSLSAIPGAITVLLDTLTLAGSAETLTATIGAIIALSSLTLASSAVALTVIPGATAVLLDALTLAGSAESLTVIPGAIVAALNTLTLASSPESLTIDASVIILLASLSLAGSAESLSVIPGATSVLLGSLTLAGSVPSLDALSGIIAVMEAFGFIFSPSGAGVVRSPLGTGDVESPDGTGTIKSDKHGRSTI